MEDAHRAGAIVWAPQTSGPSNGADDEEAARHRRRAERFGTAFVEPKPEALEGVGKGLLHVPYAKDAKAAKKAAQQQQQQQGPKPKQRLARTTAFKEPALASSVDPYSEEELAKRGARAAKFGADAAPVYAPAEAAIDVAGEQRKRDRAARFGTQYQAPDQTGLRDADVLEERRDAGAAVERRSEAVYLYGVDRLSTREVLAYFEEHGPAAAEWIDDSSCCVVFADAAAAKRAIVGRGRPLGPGQAPELQGLDPSDIKNLPLLWHRGPDFQKHGGGGKGGPAAVPLIYRMATVEDRKGMAPTKASRFLWLSKPPAAGAKRRAGQDGDGDVAMADADGRSDMKRAKRERRRARRAGLDAEMADAEGTGAEPGVRVLPSAGAQPPPELAGEELQAARAKQKAEGPSGLFSASDAGILPAFLAADGGSGEAAAEAADGGMEAEDAG